MSQNNLQSTSSPRFHCAACGACCRWPGIVRVSEAEISSIAEFLALTEDEFRRQYCLVSPDRKCLVLTDREDGACVFLTSENRCRIHPVKPLQCKTFPKKWRVPGAYMEQCQGEFL
ncbi:MAG: YkgJ family cysteine cluster protein [Lentisphaeria bacterium]|nr:YkgJ family cysteine cluster protein [Lentisphaeria bacterium]